MGASSSHHEPLDRNRHGTSFKRSASLRQTSSKGNRSSPRRMDKLRRSFRNSFRKRRENISEASKPHLWQTDEMDVRSGTCFFHVKYLGCVEVFESRGMQVCEEALRVLRNSRRRPIKAILYVSGDGLRVVEDDTKGLIVDQTIEKVSFCAPDRSHERGFSYICRDGTTRRWMCYGFVALKESGERLSHAVGCAFAVCLERKQKRDQECSVTMNFDMSNSTFTRTGSFRQQTLTDKLQDTTNVNNNVNASVTTASSTTNNTIPAATVININNSTNYDRKENIPENISIRTTPTISTHAIARPHATMSLLQRQGSFRGLSHLNHASPFKRQLSLRISDLPSNVERTRSHSLEYSLDPRTSSSSQFLHMKTPVSPIPEISPSQSDLSSSATVTDQVNAMCQELSQGLSLLTKNDDLLATKTTQSSTEITARDIFAQKVNNCSQLIGLQTVNASSSFVQKPCTENDNKIDQLLLNTNDVSGQNMDTSQNNNNSSNELSNSSVVSQQMSTVSSVENIPLTPPATPPLQNSAQLPRPDQWLGKVAQLTMNAESASPPAAKRNPSLGFHTRAFSLSSADTVMNRAAMSSAPPNDPFNIDWASLAVEPKPKNTNPFLTNSPCAATSAEPVKTTFEVQM